METYTTMIKQVKCIEYYHSSCIKGLSGINSKNHIYWIERVKVINEIIYYNDNSIQCIENCHNLLIDLRGINCKCYISCIESVKVMNGNIYYND